MSDEFFDKLKKGMNIETTPIEEEPKPDPEPEPSPEPEAVFTAAPQEEPEIIPDPKKIKKKPARKKTSGKKTAKKKAPAQKSPAGKKIEVKQESSFDEEKIDGDIFQKEGQLTVDVFETEKDIIIQSAIAGVEPEDLDISIEKDMVSIKGTRERKIEEHTESFFFQECFWGRFSREVVLPAEVDKDKAEASMKNGVLTIKMPKLNTTDNKKLNINIE
jgi:HSP20 family protein